ncbi:hypothetical protein [Aureimonas sp. ME7]|uniref:hypothetical protein n=1 Tax=Aureimonas sp. ME7 TaxID=2744252 RepID=UPI0015FB10FA|nr:hypothetical protein [Aureimonas sp. ME7]
MRTLIKLVAAAVFLVVAAGLAYYWFAPVTPAKLARTGQCEEYRAANERLEAGLESELQADPSEIQMVLDECDRQGH